MHVLRRLGKTPVELGTTPLLNGCPDIFELDNGDFAIIGRDHTDELRGTLPDNASCVAGERIVVIPRVTLLAARGDIPSSQK